MTQSSPGGTRTVRSRLTSMAVTASMLASLMSFTFATPTFASPHSASDFFAFARAEFGLARNGNEQDCDTSNDKQVDVSGSGNDIFGRLHSNADIIATSGGTTTFHGAITYGTTEDGDCVEQSEDNTNSYLAGQPQDLNDSPTGVVAGWPGDLASYLNADGLNFGNDITQVLTGIDPETGLPYVCDIGSLTNVGLIEIDQSDDPSGNGLVVCNGEGQLTKVGAQNQILSITIVSHGPIEVSGQGAVLRPEAHSILTWTDWPLDVSTKLAGSNLSVPRTAILFAPSGGIDTSGSDDADLCIQLIGQGPIKVPGSNSDFGPGSEACTENVPTPDVSVAKSPDGATINAGQTATFTIVVTNSGPGASNVTLSDTLPTAVTWTEAADPSNACTVSVGSPQLLACDFGSVPDTAGLNTRTVSISAPTDSSDCGPLDNTVTITAAGDINLSNNSNDGDITVACPNVSVAKSPDGENVTAGGTATFSILVTNNGPGAASNVMLSDTLPNGGLVWTEASDSHNACEVSAPPAPQTLTCDFGTVSDQAGQNTRTVSVSSPVDTGDCGAKVNTVTITATGDINALDNTDTGTITVLCPIIRVEKTPDEDANNPSANDINAGENATFTITVHNDGNGVANGVTVFDDLPGLGWSVVGAGTTLVGCAVTNPDIGPDADKGEILTCGPDTLGVGANKTVTVTRDTTVADCGELNNEATAAAANNGNDTDAGNIDVLCPNLVVEKTPDGEVIDAGDEISFTIKVTNNGPGTATAVVIDDELPAGFAWAEDPDLTECAITAGDLHCDVGDLASGADFSVTVSAPTDEEDCRDTAYFNTAVADASNHAAVENTGDVLIQCPDLEVEKTPDGEVIDAGDEISFTIKVTNNGPGTATAVVIDDELPAGFAWAEDPDLTECAITAGDLHCDVGDLASGADFSVTVSAPTDEEDCRDTAYFNTAVADASNHAAVENTGDVLIQCPDLEVEKTPDGEVIDAGDEISFTIKVTNNGPGTATAVVIDDELPAGFAWAEDPDLTECAITAGDLHCDVGDLASGADFSVTVSAPTDEEDCRDTAYFNTAVADASNHAAVENTGDVLIQCPDLEVEKTPDGEVIDAGDEISFTIKVTNNGPGTATAVVIDDELPAGFAWAEDPDLTECAITAGDLHCDVGDLASGADFSVTVSAPTDEEDCRDTAYFNTAVADASNHAAVENTGDVLIQCPDLEVEKTPDGEVIDAGDEISFTIKVTNNGPGTATEVDINDHLPAGFTWSEDPDLTECSIVTHLDHQDLHCDVGDLADDEFFEVTVSAPTDAEDCSDTAYVNEARADADNHAEVTNTGDVLIQCPDVTVVKEAVETPINAGDEGQFTLEVTNLGPGVATNVEVIDMPEAGTVWTVLDDDGFTCTDEVVLGQQTITCTISEMADNASATILIGYTTVGADCPIIDNAVTVTASNEPEENQANNGDTASIVVQCPGLNVLKQADEDPIDAGEEASFTITVWNTGPGNASEVELHDDLPVGMEWNFEIVNDPDALVPGEAIECNLAASLVFGGEVSYSLDCDLNTVEPSDITDEIDDEIVIRVFADTDRTDCGVMTNTAEVDASNLGDLLEALGLEEPVNVLTSTDTITVFCPIIAIEKENDAVGSVLPGTEVTYELTLTVDDETASVTDSVAEDVVVIDVMPIGLENPTDISDGGTFNPATRTITWNLGDLVHGEYSLTYNAIVADDVENGEELINAAAATSPNSQCPDLETLGPECEDESVVIPRVPTLVIDKVANTEVITISGPANAQIATPSIVTWTLSYTLTNGPVTNAVITDVVPVGFTFLDAANGGTLVGGTTVTWNLGTLTTSGSVSFRTTVNVATISRVAPTVNVAVIDSNETEPDQGQDSVTVVVTPPPLGGTPTPRLPNTAVGTGIDGVPVTVPIELLVALFIGSLGALAFANVRSSRRR